VDHPEDPETAGRDDVRRLTGVLVTFTWRREGELFPLYEGKNLIGSGGNAADRRRCDVRITKDSALSREHALIRCLGEIYEIFDEKSENGTYMNDDRVPVHGMPLEDRARIRTGATMWTFVAIRPPSSESRSRTEEGLAEDSSKHPKPHRRPTTVLSGDEKPKSPEGRRPTTILEQRDSGLERAEPESETAPVQPDKESSVRPRRDNTKVHDSEEPPPRGRDDRTKFF
jgi:hypothetical protein